MKSLARYLYTAAYSIDPNSPGVLCTVALVSLIFGMPGVGPWVREIFRRGVARFRVSPLSNHANLRNMIARPGSCRPE